MAANNTTDGNGETTNDFYDYSTELADLGRGRFDRDVAAASDRDSALYAGGPVHVRQGRVAAGMEDQVWAWNTFQHGTEDRNEREELKGDLHGGQLHRQNRAARGELLPPPTARGSRGGRGDHRGGRVEAGGRGGMMGGHVQMGSGGMPETLIAGKKPKHDAPPLAKGFAEELSADMFWDKPIV